MEEIGNDSLEISKIVVFDGRSILFAPQNA